MEHERGTAPADVEKARGGLLERRGERREPQQEQKPVYSLTISPCLKGIVATYSGRLDEGLVEKIRGVAKREYERALGERATFVRFVRAGS